MWENTTEYCYMIHSWKHAVDEEIWMEPHEGRMLNEDQASLLDLHEELVSEFIAAAPRFMRDESGNYTSFSRFWSEYWSKRIKEELKRLDDDQLTDAERRGAEGVGVQWCERPPEKAEVENPYRFKTPEYYLFELDQICPEYREYDFRD
ncbi:hypothetical protein PG991_013940 [Apiospora marii]|uniref:Uncharacterized protein n=1 Tax=Apiospora marii TaxID=335849 RepID=A0ABR1R7K5_9PEZI